MSTQLYIKDCCRGWKHGPFYVAAPGPDWYDCAAAKSCSQTPDLPWPWVYVHCYCRKQVFALLAEFGRALVPCLPYKLSGKTVVDNTLDVATSFWKAGSSQRKAATCLPCNKKKKIALFRFPWVDLSKLKHRLRQSKEIFLLLPVYTLLYVHGRQKVKVRQLKSFLTAGEK